MDLVLWNILSTLPWAVVMLAALAIFYKLTEWMLRIKLVNEVAERDESGSRGNAAVGILYFGMFAGIGEIVQGAIAAGDTVWQAVLYSGVGYALMMLGFWAFELMTPFSLRKELDNHNRLCAWLMAGVFFAVGKVVAAALV